jgi:hypothetical protein
MSQEPKDPRVLPLVLARGTVRFRDDGHINVLDLERLIPDKEQWEKSWAAFFAHSYETLASIARRHGLPVKTMVEAEDTTNGEHLIWVQQDFALDFASYISPDLRADILITYRRALSGDTALAAEILQRSYGDEKQQWIETRQRLQQHTIERNDEIKKRDGKTWIYPYCADELNKATTGHTSSEICAIAAIPTNRTRDALDTSHLALQLLGESEQMKEMRRWDARGNSAIQRAVDPVHVKIRNTALHFNLHDDRLLYDRAHYLQNRVPQLPMPPEPPRDSAQYACRDAYDETLYIEFESHGDRVEAP